jgi:hypothetical protein
MYCSSSLLLATFLVAGTLVLIRPSGMNRMSLARVQTQDELVVRTPPPALDDLETDANLDGLPDGWYNARNATLVSEKGAPVGPHFVRFERSKPGGPAVLSLAFGIDGKKTSAIELGIWVRLKNVQLGDRDGGEPSLVIDFLGPAPSGVGPAVGRAALGPWTHTVRENWTRVVKRIPVPPGTKDAIMSVGLMGCAGILDVDGLTVVLIGVDETSSTNLVVNGDFELGDPAPYCWSTEKDAKRVFPGFNSSAAVELRERNARLLTGLAIPVEPFDSLDISLAVRATGLRGEPGAGAVVFFLDELGRPLGGQMREFALTWSDSFDWRVDTAEVRVPRGARRAVFQLEKSNAGGVIRFDDIRITASPNPGAGTWSPFQVADDTDEWLEVPPSGSIKPDSALDVSFLQKAPAGDRGSVTVKNGHLTFGGKERARFFGVSLLPPAAFLPAEAAERLADRLARSGVNLVRMGDLDSAYGPDRSLFEDSRDDTKEFDPIALDRLDHLIAELKKRGIYVAIELQSKRRFRVDDGVALMGLLPSGGGPAAIFDPKMGQLALESATALLGHKNQETDLALKEDPALAWVTLMGETSLFDLLESPGSLPDPYAKKLHELEKRAKSSAGHRFWESLESDHLKKTADALRKDELRAPIAGISHWRRDPEFVAAQAAPGLDLIDDRVYWPTLPWSSPEVRSMLFASPARALDTIAGQKRAAERPYVLGQWCNQSNSAWSFPDEAGDFMLGAYMAMNSDWDGVVRRGIFVFPLVWGAGAAGTVGGEDIFQIAEVVNGSPHIYALWPHAASLFLRGRSDQVEAKGRAVEAKGRAVEATAKPKGRRRLASGWDSARGRLHFETPFTQGAAGWIRGETASFPQLELSTENPFAVLVATSISTEPIASTKRLLVSAIAHVEPTGFRWVSGWKREVADPGRPPFLQEPVTATVVWRRKGTVRCYVLNNEGDRVSPVPLEGLPDGEGVVLKIDGKTPAFHWEFTVE